MSPPIWILTLHHYQHDHISIYTFIATPHFLCENLGQQIFPHMAREGVHTGPEEELIHQASVNS